MAKVETNPVTRRQKFLGAIAGDNDAPAPITENEKLLYNIAEQVQSGGGGDELPEITADAKGRLLRVNDDGETLEWADEDGSTLPKVTVVLHSTPTGQRQYWYTIKGSTTHLTYDELNDLYLRSFRHEIKLVGERENGGELLVSYFGTNYVPEASSTSIQFTYITKLRPFETIRVLWVQKTGEFIYEYQLIDAYKLDSSVRSQLLPTATASDNGSTLVVKNGAWAKSLKHDYDMVQPIPVLYNPTPTPEQFMFETEITIEDAESGYTLTRNGEQIDCPGINEASMTFAYVYLDGSDWWDGARIELFPIHTNADGITFQSEMGPLDDIGMTGQVGFFRFDSTGRDHAYRVHLCSWSATTV